MGLKTRNITEREAIEALCLLFDDRRLVDPTVEPRFQYESSAGEILAEIEVCFPFGRNTQFEYLNAKFKASIANEVWHSIFDDPNAKVRDVCRVLSEHVQIPDIDKTVVFGKPCRAAGAFRACRELLIEGGEDPGRIAPSTPASELRASAMVHLFHHLFIAAPHLAKYCPLPSIHDGWLLLGAAIGLIGTIAAATFAIGLSSLTALCWSVSFAALLAGCCRRSWSYFLKPDHVRYLKPYTLKELAKSWAASPTSAPTISDVTS